MHFIFRDVMDCGCHPPCLFLFFLYLPSCFRSRVIPVIVFFCVFFYAFFCTSGCPVERLCILLCILNPQLTVAFRWPCIDFRLINGSLLCSQWLSFFPEPICLSGSIGFQVSNTCQAIDTALAYILNMQNEKNKYAIFSFYFFNAIISRHLVFPSGVLLFCIFACRAFGCWISVRVCTSKEVLPNHGAKPWLHPVHQAPGVCSSFFFFSFASKYNMTNESLIFFTFLRVAFRSFF